MRKDIGAIKTLSAFQPDLALTCLQLCAAWSESTTAGIHKARTYTMRYKQSGYLVRVNPHQNPALYKLSDKGKTLLATWEQERVAPSKKRRSVPMSATVTPVGLVNSVFALSIHLNKDCKA